MMILWVASNGIPSDVLNKPRLKLPMKNMDPIWVWEELERDDSTRDENGNREWRTDRNKLELMMFAKAK